ncbi:MAG: TonB family protein, partial [Geminicoccaceae bacterium]
ADPAPSPAPRELAVERAAPKPAKPARDRPARTAAERTEPERVAALPTGAGEVRAGPAGSGADHGKEAGSELGSDRGGSAAGDEGGGEPPGFAPGSADNPLPRYPTVARRRGIEGTVTLEVKVSASGLAEQVVLARSSGSALLDEAALEAVRRWRFRPARRGGEAVPGVVTVPITFRLLEPERAALR